MKIARLLVLCFALVGSAHAAMSAREQSAFAADLQVLKRELPKRHADFFHTGTREHFTAAVSALEKTLPTLSRMQALTAFAGLAGHAQDGHTALFMLPFPGTAPIAGISQIPMQFMHFEDGVRVIAAARELASCDNSAQHNLLGAKLMSVGKVPIAEALERIAPLLPRDNLQGVREYAPLYLALPAVLHALGLSDSPDGVEFEFATAGATKRVRLRSQHVPNTAWIDQLVTLPGPRNAWVGANDCAPPVRWLAETQRQWWHETLPNGDVYAQINAMRETPDARFEDFAKATVGRVAKQGKGKLILDLRLNRGGNADLLWPLIYAIIRHDAVNQPDRLFVITSRRTFSAAQNLANALEKHTQARFVGEPTGSSPNHYGELGTLLLPNTGLKVFVSLLRFQHDPRDLRPWIAPHIAAPLSYADLRAGRDPALAAINAYAPPQALAKLLESELAANDAPAALAKLRALTARYRNPWRNLFETELNTLGYQQLSAKRLVSAEALLAFNTELYPDSSNAWDSLGEARLASGKRAAAAFAYARAVKLNPKAQYSADALDAILGVTR